MLATTLTRLPLFPVPTGFTQLDEDMVTPMEPGWSQLIIGRVGVGKTTHLGIRAAAAAASTAEARPHATVLMLSTDDVSGHNAVRDAAERLAAGASDRLRLASATTLAELADAVYRTVQSACTEAAAAGVPLAEAAPVVVCIDDADHLDIGLSRRSLGRALRSLRTLDPVALDAACGTRHEDYFPGGFPAQLVGHQILMLATLGVTVDCETAPSFASLEETREYSQFIAGLDGGQPVWDVQPGDQPAPGWSCLIDRFELQHASSIIALHPALKAPDGSLEAQNDLLWAV
ncbi:hypothetical protein [Motilibacter deserti]|uniref:AAA domain-containing protein n=1 Tax=Motilibacter deserti TaxID=2714956 RepID=A0ABX0GPA5_9ACTN|nr:hypothetical protein [Motilibacter deserti]NHC12672.1 hypothetical protein [Motilibacter deserti]